MGKTAWLCIAKYMFGATLLSLVVWFVTAEVENWLKRKKYRFVQILPSLKIYGILLIFLSAFYLIIPCLPLSSHVYNLTYKAVVFGLFFLVFWAIGVFVEFVLGLYSEKVFRNIPITGLLWAIIRWTILSIGILVGLDAIGIPITTMITNLGVGGVAVALAVQDILSNIFAGFTMLVAHQIKPGDYIIVGDGIEGFVKDITWRNTVLYSPLMGIDVIVPNNNMAQSIIKSAAAGSGKFGFVVSVGVSYDTDLMKAYKIVSDVAMRIINEIPEVNNQYPPIVAYQEFGNSSININVLFRMHNPAPLARWKVTDLFVKEVKKAFDEAGVEIPFSQHDIHIRDVNVEQFEKLMGKGGSKCDYTNRQ